jgi:hypothetical protein
MEACACPRSLRMYRRYRHYDEEHLKAMLNREGIGAAKVAIAPYRTRTCNSTRAVRQSRRVLCAARGRTRCVWSLRRVAGGYAARGHTG